MGIYPKKYWTVCIAVALLGLVAVLAADLRSSEASIIGIKVSGQEFYVPKNYLKGWGSGKRFEEKGSFTVQFLLPGFEAYNGENRHEFDVKRKRVLEINIHPFPGENADPSTVYNYYDQNPWLENEISKEGTYSEPQKVAPGIYKYVDRDTEGWREDLFVYYEGEKIRFVLKCLREGDPPNPNCVNERAILGNLKLHYRYPLKFLSQATEIDRRVETLINSFLNREGE